MRGRVRGPVAFIWGKAFGHRAAGMVKRAQRFARGNGCPTEGGCRKTAQNRHSTKWPHKVLRRFCDGWRQGEASPLLPFVWKKRGIPETGRS